MNPSHDELRDDARRRLIRAEDFINALERKGDTDSVRYRAAIAARDLAVRLCEAYARADAHIGFLDDCSDLDAGIALVRALKEIVEIESGDSTDTSPQGICICTEVDSPHDVGGG